MTKFIVEVAYCFEANSLADADKKRVEVDEQIKSLFEDDALLSLESDAEEDFDEVEESEEEKPEDA
jgi:hypothetical protein